MRKVQDYIEKIGFSGKLEKTKFGELFSYKKELSKFEIKKQMIFHFIFYKNEKSLFNYHLTEWNKNELDYFIAIGLEKSHIIKAKEKPDENNPFKKEVLVGEEGFDYGINTKGYEDIVTSEIPFTKDKIDNAVFFDFVLQKTKDIKNEVDTHLLNNLIALKNELSKFDDSNNNINALILKSLFIKYLEDRNILINISLSDTLKTGNPEMLEQTFKDISIINGDILKKNLIITPEHINELRIFFTHDYQTYKNTKQQNLFYPYRFDKIPIQLISNIYEEFLGKTNLQEKKNKGIFYTRTFVVDFMLSHTIYPKIKKQPHSTILDPACGSGAFLVQTFKHILNAQTKKISIDEKANILKKQIFGIDTDASALQITAFSLYLTLLDGISKEEIQEQIKIRNPILPSLTGSNLLRKNTITDEIKFNIEIEKNNEKENYIFSQFDCIVANPPWKELKKGDEKDSQIKKSREKISDLDIYKNVSKYQISQAFLLKINTFSHYNTDIAIIVNNSNFLNEGAKEFRKEILEKYRLKYFYELSEVASILFKGTEHPSAILILDKKTVDEHIVKYITPQLTDFSRKLRLISYSSKDVKEVKQIDLQGEDILWRIFVKGNWKDYQVIKKIEFKKNDKFKISFCSGGIIYDGATPKGSPVYKKRLEAKYLKQFFIIDSKLKNFNINQEFERGREKNHHNLFTGSRILIKRQLTKSDNHRLICSYTKNDYIFGQQVMSAKLENNEYNNPISGILNSSLIGFYFNQTASQANRNKTIPAVKVNEIKQLPIIELKKAEITVINTLIKKLKFDTDNENNIIQLDEFVFNLYGLLEFEKEIIREFYQINVERKNDFVKVTDIETYAEKFRDTYQVVIKNNLRLNISFIKSLNIGSVIKFEIVDKQYYIPEITRGGFTQKGLLKLVKDKKIQNEKSNGYINEEKVKIYDGKSFYIIKSNQFKDWTKRQATDDANEELHEIIKKMQS